MEPGEVSGEIAVMPDTVLNCFMPYVKEPKDRGAASLVCRSWYRVENETRNHVTIAFCYTTTPERLHRRYPSIQSLKLEGKPSMWSIMPKDWGGYAEPWIGEIGRSFNRLEFLHFHLMTVTDLDLEVLARRTLLQALKLQSCSGFSTNGLLHITHSCSNLRTLFLEGSKIEEFNGEWLHELALNNTVLESLNFYMTELKRYEVMDLEILATNCQSLVSVKVSECDIERLHNFFLAATRLREFHGGAFNFADRGYENVVFPTTVYQLGLLYMVTPQMDLIFPFSASLKQLDLLHVHLNTNGHCLLIERCPNLEVLEATNVIGDRGLEALAAHCKKLRRLRIERHDAIFFVPSEARVTERGLIPLSQGCLDLEYLEVYAFYVTNGSLESIGTYMKNLSEFHLMTEEEGHGRELTDLPLDNGVRALLRGCNQKLTRFALELCPGSVTNVGLVYIGQNSPNVRSMLLRSVGESDEGLLAFSTGCPSLQKLEITRCRFTKRALAVAARRLTALRYLWVNGYISSGTDHDLLAMALPYWNIELIPIKLYELSDVGRWQRMTAILAYYSLDGPRSDVPNSVRLLGA